MYVHATKDSNDHFKIYNKESNWILGHHSPLCDIEIKGLKKTAPHWPQGLQAICMLLQMYFFTLITV